MLSADQINPLDLLAMYGFTAEVVDDSNDWMGKRIGAQKIGVSWAEGACHIHGKSPEATDIVNRLCEKGVYSKVDDGKWIVETSKTIINAVELSMSGELDFIVVDKYGIDIDPIIKRCWLIVSPSPETTKDIIGEIERELPKTNQPAILHNLYGKMLELDGREMEAVQAFRKSVEHNRSYGEAYSNFGAVLWAGGAKDEAFSLLVEAVIKNPWDEVGWLNFFNAGYERGAYQDMANIIEHVGKTSAAYVDVLNLHHAICLTRMGRYADARAEIRGYLDMNPNDEEAKLILAEAEYLIREEEELAEAEKDLAK